MSKTIIKAYSDAAGVAISANRVSTNAISSASAADSNTRYLVDTSGAAFTLTLPATPAIGDWVEVWDQEGTFNTNNLTIARNGNNIEGAAADYTEDRDNARIKLVYASASRGWLVGDMT